MGDAGSCPRDLATWCVSKPDLPWENKEALAKCVLRAVCIGEAIVGLDLSALLPRQR